MAMQFAADKIKLYSPSTVRRNEGEARYGPEIRDTTVDVALSQKNHSFT